MRISSHCLFVFPANFWRHVRFMTIIYYLSDVEEGGETAFPIADNETYTVEVSKTPLNGFSTGGGGGGC